MGSDRYHLGTTKGVMLVNARLIQRAYSFGILRVKFMLVKCKIKLSWTKSRGWGITTHKEGTEVNFLSKFCMALSLSRLTLGKPSVRSCLLAHNNAALSMPTNQCCVNNGSFGMKFPSCGNE